MSVMPWKTIWFSLNTLTVADEWAAKQTKSQTTQVIIMTNDIRPCGLIKNWN